MQRREFLRALAAGAACLSAAALPERFIPFAEARDIPKFLFAHITDLHLDVQGTSSWQHREKSVPLFIDALRQLGRLPRLAFVLFGGDQVHAGPHDQESLVVFQEWSKHLDVPWYVLLGNMEVSPVAGQSHLDREDYLAAWRGRGPAPGRSSWAFDPVKGVRVIGFDVTVDGSASGEASAAGLAWLERELEGSRDRRLVIIATHQPLLPTGPLDRTPAGALWLVRNHAVVRDLLDGYPNVRMAISGHHHATCVERVNNITYVADPAVVSYPCAFRLFEVAPEGIHLRSIGLEDRGNIGRARELLLADPYARLFDPDDPQRVLAFSAGLTEADRETTIPL